MANIPAMNRSSSGSAIDDYIAAKKTEQTDTTYNTIKQDTRVPKSELGKDDFLNLLVAQMANQDPLETKSDTEFIAQMAQFSALEQMQALNETFAVSQAQSMIGKYVGTTITKLNEESGLIEKEPLYGMVTGIFNSGGKTYLQVGSYNIDPNDIEFVFDASAYDNSILNGSSLVNKYITATIPPVNKGEEPIEINGKVDRIEVIKGEVCAIVGDKEIKVSYITAVSDKEIPPKPKPDPDKTDPDKTDPDKTDKTDKTE